MPSPLTIRAQLFALTAAFVLPTVGIFAYTVVDDARHQVTDAKAVARTLAVIASSDVGRVLKSNRDLLEQMAKRPVIRKVDARQCDSILWDFRQLFPRSANMTVIDLKGTAVCSAVPQPGGKPVSIAKSPWFPRTKASNDLVVSDPFYGPITGRWVTVLTYPIRDEHGGKRGYLGLPLDLARYEPNMTDAPLPPGTVVGVITEQGVLVWRSIDPEKWVGKNLADHPLLAVKDGETEATGADGVRRFYSITPIAGVSWYAYVGVPTKTVYDDLRETLWRNVLLGVISLLFILGIAWRIARSMAIPIRTLAEVAREVGRGRQDQRAILAGPPEIQEVAREFNEMLDVRLRTEAALRDSQASLSEALQIAKLGYWEYEFESGEFLFNDRYFALHHATFEQFGSYRLSAEVFAQRWVHADDASLIERIVRQASHASDADAIASQELRILCPDAEVRWLSLNFRVEQDARGSIVRLIGAAQDITERKYAELAQLRLNRALKLLSDCNTTLVHAVDEGKLLADICRLVVEIGGYRMAWVGFGEYDEARTVRPVAQCGDDDNYLGTQRFSWADTEAGNGPTGMAVRTGLTDINQDFSINPRLSLWRKAALARGFHSSIALPLVGKKRVFGALTIYAAETGAFEREEVRLLEEMANDLAYGVETLRTRDEHAEAERKLEFMAHHDMLTGLPNRVLLRDRFDQAIAEAERNHWSVAVLFLDLDNFKQVNDTLGHDFGDRLLVGVVGRLRGCLRDSDTISRQGGDEFIVLVPHLADPSVIGSIVQHIVEEFSEPFEIDGYAINTSFSIGISLFPLDSNDFNTLLRSADTAMYQAKDSGRNTYRFFSEKMNQDAQEQLYLQGQLRQALKNREFRLHFQPQIDIASGRVIGAEALLRWHHPELGLVPPGRFISLAERSGLIIPIGEWVMHEACRQARIWCDQGQPLRVAVNLSAMQFRRGTLIDTVTQALQQSGLSAALLELELTESLLLQDVEAAIRVLHSLKEMGVKLSIDDFGTGYSSLSYLKRLSVDKLKIDQSFVRDLTEDDDSEAIVRAIIQLGHTLQLGVIAEGVESQAQFAALRDYGCDEVQGYLFSTPLSVEDFATWLTGRTE